MIIKIIPIVSNNQSKKEFPIVFYQTNQKRIAYRPQPIKNLQQNLLYRGAGQHRTGLDCGPNSKTFSRLRQDCNPTMIYDTRSSSLPTSRSKNSREKLIKILIQRAMHSIFLYFLYLPRNKIRC